MLLTEDNLTREELKDLMLDLPEHRLVRLNRAWQKANEECSLMIKECYQTLVDSTVLNALIQLANA